MVAAIIQARLGSTRLPGKVLKQLNRKPLLEHIVDRTKICKNIDYVLVATTNNPLDDDLCDWCKKNSIDCFRGDESNVLKRYYDAATAINANIIVRITADDPFKDPNVIDAVIEQLIEHELDFSFNNSPPTFPEGLDTEVFTYSALKSAYYSDTTKFEKEHVTQFFYHNSDKYKMMNYSYKEDLSNIRLTIDSDEDFILAKKIYECLSPNGEMFYLDDILQLFKSHKELLEINKNVKRSAMYV